jgi:hypothetical protein
METTKIFIRKIPGTKIVPGMRVLESDTQTVWDITGVLPNRLRDMMTLMCTSGINNG